MDAFGYRLENDKTQFTWIVREGNEVLQISGPLGEIRYDFAKAGHSPEDWDAAVNAARSAGFVFDFNDKCRELVLRFPLSGIADLHHFRFELAEPALHYALQQSGNGFCDYAFCDEQFLVFLPWVYDPEIAVSTIQAVLELENIPADGLQIWTSEKGLPIRQLWPRANL